MIFGEERIIKNKFHIYERLVSVKVVRVFKVENNIVKKDSYGNKGSYKYFIGYIFEGIALPSSLCIKFSLRNAYDKYCDKNSKYIIFLVNIKEILEKYNKMCDENKNLLIKNLIVNQRIMINT